MFCCFSKESKIITKNLIFVKNLFNKKDRSIKLYHKKEDKNKFYIIKTHQNIIQYDNELDILCDLYHKNIIQILYSQKYNRIGYLKFPYYKNGDLFQYLQKNYPINKIQIITIFKKILDIINYCHSRNIIHGDLKLENFVMDNNFYPVLIDFENSHRISKYQFLKNNILNISGTIGYISPECYLFKIGKCSDIWSLGCLLFYLNFGYSILGDYLDMNSNMIKINDWDILNLYMKYPKNCDKNLLDLLKKMLEPYPKKRIKLNEIFKHPYIDHFNYLSNKNSNSSRDPNE